MITTFTKRLLARGHELEVVQKLIKEASQYILSIMPSHKIYVRNKKQMQNNISDTIYFHAEYHSHGVPRKLLQRAFRSTIKKLGRYNKIMVCYRRPTNILDLLIPSTLRDIEQSKPSDYIQKINYIGPD